MLSGFVCQNDYLFYCILPRIPLYLGAVILDSEIFKWILK
jgi:hypothetical protein